jgi:hypothetical protein
LFLLPISFLHKPPGLCDIVPLNTSSISFLSVFSPTFCPHPPAQLKKFVWLLFPK